MPIELNDDTRRALGIAVQILEDMPEALRPASSIDDMRQLLAGETTGRDGYIVTEAIACTLAWRTTEVIEGSANADAYINRMEEFAALFAVAQHTNARLFAIKYVEMCDRLARSREAPQ